MWEVLDVGGTGSRQITSFEVPGAHHVRYAHHDVGQDSEN